MKILEFISEDRILIDSNVTDKKSAIEKVAYLLKGSKDISDFELFVSDVFDRENLSTTGIGNNIALPHARTDSVNDFVIAFGKFSKGVEFDSLDNKPVNLIFLMGTPKEKGLNDYLKVLAYLNRLLSRESFRAALIKAQSSKDVLEEFKKAKN